MTFKCCDNTCVPNAWAEENVASVTNAVYWYATPEFLPPPDNTDFSREGVVDNIKINDYYIFQNLKCKEGILEILSPGNGLLYLNGGDTTRFITMLFPIFEQYLLRANCQIKFDTLVQLFKSTMAALCTLLIHINADEILVVLQTVLPSASKLVGNPPALIDTLINLGLYDKTNDCVI